MEGVDGRRHAGPGRPANGSYGIRADSESGEGIHRVALELTLESTGEKQVERTDDAAPYSLYGDEGEDALHGESLPVGSYTLKATAYTEDGETLGSLEISFTVALAQAWQAARPGGRGHGAGDKAELESALGLRRCPLRGLPRRPPERQHERTSIVEARHDRRGRQGHELHR